MPMGMGMIWDRDMTAEWKTRMVQQWDVTEVEIDGRSFWVRPVSTDVLLGGNVVAVALAESLGKPPEWAVGFFFGDLELSLELWTTIAGISGFDD